MLNPSNGPGARAWLLGFQVRGVRHEDGGRGSGFGDPGLLGQTIQVRQGDRNSNAAYHRAQRDMDGVGGGGESEP